MMRAMHPPRLHPASVPHRLVLVLCLAVGLLAVGCSRAGFGPRGDAGPSDGAVEVSAGDLALRDGLVVDKLPADGLEADGPSADGGPPAPLLIEGYGKSTQGAVGCPGGYTIYRVSTLADVGPGSLRDALKSGCRYIVFDVAGLITLTSDLTISESYTTIDGRTAPAPGITIHQANDTVTSIAAPVTATGLHDVIVTHLRFIGMSGGASSEILRIDGGFAPIHNVVISHVSALQTKRGALDVVGAVSDVTLSWNLIRGNVSSTSFHPEVHVVRRISVHHNVFADNNEGQVKLHANVLDVDYVNNVVFGWGSVEKGASGIFIVHAAGQPHASANIEKSVFHWVQGYFGDGDSAIVFGEGASAGSFYFAGNTLPSTELDAVSTVARLPIPADREVVSQPASTLWQVVGKVGPQYLTPEETVALSTISAAIKP